MAIQVEVSGMEKSLPELIMIILSRDYPLTISELQTRLREKYRIKVSFQAIRKALNIMVEQNKLVQKRKEYQVSKGWIKDNKQLTDELIKNYFRGERKERPPKISSIGRESQVFQFENPLQTDKFFGELLLDIASVSGEKTLCIQAMHYWYFLGHFGTESDFIQEMIRRKTKLIYVAYGDRSLDKLSKKFYKQHGVEFEILSTEEFDKYSEVAVINDVIIEIKYPKEFIDELHGIFKKTKNLENLNFLKFGKAIKGKFATTITILRNKTMANNIRQSILRHFKK
jgi:hypothetical protein